MNFPWNFHHHEVLLAALCPPGMEATMPPGERSTMKIAVQAMGVSIAMGGTPIAGWFINVYKKKSYLELDDDWG